MQFWYRLILKCFLSRTINSNPNLDFESGVQFLKRKYQILSDIMVNNNTDMEQEFCQHSGFQSLTLKSALNPTYHLGPLFLT